jgi:hypothetical protein
MCTVLLPPGDNPIAVNKYIKYDFLQTLKISSLNSITWLVSLVDMACVMFCLKKQRNWLLFYMKQLNVHIEGKK